LNAPDAECRSDIQRRFDALNEGKRRYYPNISVALAKSKEIDRIKRMQSIANTPTAYDYVKARQGCYLELLEYEMGDTMHCRDNKGIATFIGFIDGKDSLMKRALYYSTYKEKPFEQFVEVMRQGVPELGKHTYRYYAKNNSQYIRCGYVCTDNADYNYEVDNINPHEIQRWARLNLLGKGIEGIATTLSKDTPFAKNYPVHIATEMLESVLETLGIGSLKTVYQGDWIWTAKFKEIKGCPVDFRFQIIAGKWFVRVSTPWKVISEFNAGD